MKLALRLFLAVSLLTLPLYAGEQKAEKQQPAPAPAEQAMMDAWSKAGTPGAAHKKLESLLGTWDVKVVTWMAPGAAPSQSSGVAVNEWVLGGRWIRQSFKGEFMGTPFEGVGYTGYDNVKKAYVGTWMDTTSTGVMVSTGSMDASGKTAEFTSTMDDPVTGKPFPVKELSKMVDNDHFVFEMYGPAPDGTTFKTMEMTYTRKK